MSIPSTMTALVCGLALASTAGGAALAQEAAPAVPAQPETTAPSTDFDQDQIEAFAIAYLEIMDIGNQANQQIQGAETDDDRLAIQVQAQEQMAAAVDNIEGVTIDDYNAMVIAAQSDPALADRVQDEIDSLIVESN